jgi:hypothetical protein
MKTCKECGRLLPLADFYPHPMMGDGHLNKCKDCKRAYARRYGRGPQARAYDRSRNGAERRRQDRLERARRERAEQPAKSRARLRVRRAVKAGRLTPTPCVVCGSADVQAHHHRGYEPENALDVLWLCQQHHSEQHRRYDAPRLLVAS